MLTLAELRQCRVAAQTALLWLDANNGTAERVAAFQSLIARLDEEMGEAADDASFEV